MPIPTDLDDIKKEITKHKRPSHPAVSNHPAKGKVEGWLRSKGVTPPARGKRERGFEEKLGEHTEPDGQIFEDFHCVDFLHTKSGYQIAIIEYDEHRLKE